MGGLGREPQRGAGRSPAKKILPVLKGKCWGVSAFFVKFTLQARLQRLLLLFLSLPSPLLPSHLPLLLLLLMLPHSIRLHALRRTGSLPFLCLRKQRIACALAQASAA